MAQLIKLHDYVSRYEWNVYRYPSQYIRLKQDNWKSLYHNWTNDILEENIPLFENPKEENSKITKLKELFFKQSKANDETQLEENIHSPIKTELELRQHFLDKLFPFQIKWATSTVTDTSVLDKNYEQDETLKYFLQRFPDIYFIMYYPVFNIKNAPVDGEIIMISPSEIEIITLMEFDPKATIIAGDDRTWGIERGINVQQTISPLILLRRTEHMVRSILNSKNIQFPIKRSVLSRTNQIVFTTAPFNTNIIGYSQYDDWFNQKRQISAPLKSEQLKVAEALLNFCVSISIKRPEWDEDHDPFTVGE